jgi:hypothetical protein
MDRDSIEVRKQINDHLQQLYILGVLQYSTKAKLTGLHGQGKCEKFLDLQNFSALAKRNLL